MKNKKIFCALAVLLAATNVSALERSYEGTGQAILLPYYSAADGEATIFTVNNHSDRAKAVRVAVVEGRNGRIALAWNVYLSPHDSWNGAITPGPAVPAGAPRREPRLVTNEESCSLPAITDVNSSLRKDGFTGSRADNLGTDVARLEHGSIEIVELGVPAGAAAEMIAQRSCVSLIDRFSFGEWDASPNFEIGVPDGGLSAQAQIVDVASGVAYHTESVTLDGFSARARHDAPGRFNSDSFKEARFSKPTAPFDYPAFRIGSNAQIENPADAVSLLLMSTAFEAGFLGSDTLGASTRVVLAFPTRNAYLDNFVGGEVPLGSAPLTPFRDASRTAPYCIDTAWQAIDGTGHVHASRTLPMCEQVNVIDLVKQDAGAGEFATDSEAGRVRIGLKAQGRTVSYTVIGDDAQVPQFAFGLPAVVSSLSRISNANAQPGVLASYALAHRVMREVENDGGF